MYATTVPSPLGPVQLEADARGALTALRLRATRGRSSSLHTDPAPFADVIEQLEAYFAGERRSFELDLAPAGTAWQQQVWAAVGAIPHGETTTYGTLAAQLGRPTAARAVGAANGANPICIVIPCHRVVGSDGSLTGYAYGLPAKAALLELEHHGAPCPTA